MNGGNAEDERAAKDARDNVTADRTQRPTRTAVWSALRKYLAAEQYQDRTPDRKQGPEGPAGGP
jgi:hypothetical protein